MAHEWASDQYDAVYATGGEDGIYDLPYQHSGYFPLFKAVADALADRPTASILEVGCGTGGFAQLWTDRHAGARIRGFDFSPVAVQRAQRRTAAARFFVGDARDPANYDEPHDALVCTEVLEHIEEDLAVVQQWRPGTFCVCSVPNFPAENHVRHFVDEAQVLQRYGAFFDAVHIRRVKKPYLYDISPANRWRQIRWNRYRPRTLAKILGWSSFEEAGGWFVLAGTKRAATQA